VPTQDWVDGYRAGWFDARNDELPRGKVAPIADATTKKGDVRKTARRAYEPKKKRGPSAYNKKYAKAYKSLKKKHPRTSFAALAKKAHAKAKRMK